MSHVALIGGDSPATGSSALAAGSPAMYGLDSTGRGTIAEEPSVEETLCLHDFYSVAELLILSSSVRQRWHYHLIAVVLVGATTAVLRLTSMRLTGSHPLGAVIAAVLSSSESMFRQSVASPTCEGAIQSVSVLVRTADRRG